MPRPVLVAHHVRTGLAALNVVTAAVDGDARTAGTEVRFAKGREALVAEIEAVRAGGGAPIVLWSFYSCHFPDAAADLGWVRERSPGSGALHVAGGVHATADPEGTLRAGFDLVAIGEGESMVVDLVRAVADGRAPHALPGTAHLAGGRLVSHGPGERRPLDEFPGFNVRYGKWNALEITRGCVYACSFCQTPFMFKARFRHRSVENVREHVLAMAEHGVRYMRFVTPTALSYGATGEAPDLAKVEALLAAVRESLGPAGKLYFGTFPSELRPEHVTREALELLRRYADNRTLVIGGQSGSERVLAAMRRGHGVEDVVRAVRLSVESGFVPDVDLLIGMPGETRDDREASIALAERLVGMGARIHGHSFLPLPGTPLEGEEPEPIEQETVAALARMEGTGAVHGHWRRQMIEADRLVGRTRRRAT